MFALCLDRSHNLVPKKKPTLDQTLTAALDRWTRPTATERQRIFGNRCIPHRPPETDKKKGKALFAVVNSARAVPGSCGPVVSTHSTWTAATRAAKAKHVYRVLEIRNPLNVGDHANPMTDVIFDRNGRWG